MKWRDRGCYRSNYVDHDGRIHLILGPLGIINGACKTHAKIIPAPSDLDRTKDWKQGSVHPRRSIAAGEALLCYYGDSYPLTCPVCGQPVPKPKRKPRLKLFR